MSAIYCVTLNFDSVPVYRDLVRAEQGYYLRAI